MIYNFDDLSFQILMIDRFIHKEGFFEVSARPFSAFSFRISGSGAFEIGNKRFVTQKGDVLFLPANMPYKVEYSISESIVVHFDHCNYFEAENICLDNIATIELLFGGLLESWNAQRSVNQAKSTIYKILETIGKDKRRSLANSTFARCVRYIDTHFCESELDINTVCNIGFIRASSLQRAFNTHLGLSPKQYLLKLRMSRALELLADNKLSVKEIAFACGFKDEKYFSRAFKSKYGYPPSHIQNDMFV